MTARTESESPVVVTGATGNVGREVVLGLLRSGVRVRAAVTNPARARGSFLLPDRQEAARLEFVPFAFGRGDTYPAAFQGARALFLMRPPQIGDARRLINPAVDAAARAGVERVSFLSLQGAERNPVVPHHAIERHLEQSGLAHTFLRAAFFMQNLATTHRADIRDHNDILVPAGKGRTAFIDVRDIAAVAVKTLTERGHAAAYELTGSEALTYDEVAASLSEVLGRRILYPHPNVLQFWARRRALGDHAAFILVMTALYSVAALGQAGRLTNDVPRLLGRDPITFAQFARDYTGVWQLPPTT